MESDDNDKNSNRVDDVMAAYQRRLVPRELQLFPHSTILSIAQQSEPIARAQERGEARCPRIRN